MGGVASGPAGLSSLGLRSDPFDVSDIRSSDSAGVKLAIKAAANRLLNAIDEQADDPEHRPIVVHKSDIPAYYHVSALSLAMRSFAAGGESSDLVGLYVPIDMMRIGRARSVLHAAAEWAASVGGEAALAGWLRVAFDEADHELKEWQALDAFPDERGALPAQLGSDPVAAVRRLFGDPALGREGAEDLEFTMRVSMARIGRLDADPEEQVVAAGEEEASDDPMGDAFTSDAGGDGASGPDGPTFEELALDYVVAYTRAHLSPVVARGLKAYAAQGSTAMAEELKVSKAPTKTLTALLRYSTAARRAATVVLDRFDMWTGVPQDLRIKIVSTLTSIRWAVKEHAGLVLMLTRGTAPEVEEAFAAGREVDWGFDELVAVESHEAPFDPAIVERWIAAASDGAEAPVWCEQLLAAVPAGVDLATAVSGLQAAISDAVASQAVSPDPAVLLSALETDVEVG